MSEVNLNYVNSNYSYVKENSSKKTQEQTKDEPKVQNETKAQASAENVLSALDNIGLQKFAMVKTEAAEVDTTKYVDEASEARITDSIKAFEQFMSLAQSEGIPQSVAEQAALRFIG